MIPKHLDFYLNILDDNKRKIFGFDNMFTLFM